MSRLKEQLSLVPFNNRFRLLKLCSLTALALLVSVIETFAQTKITGVVKESNGEPLTGVAVKVKGERAGTQTNINGQFDITVSGPNAVLVFSYVGFTTKEVKVGNQAAINVTLVENASNLEEVVVLGYGNTVKKKDLTGAISSVSAKEIDERQPINIFDALQGKGAGVLVVNDGGGEPGATGTIQIRGNTTLNAGNEPLYVVDGVLSPDGNLINPTDIESIEVFKDAAAAAIYGTRAANGVILITTKRGKDGKPNLNISYNHLFGRLAHGIPVSNSAEVRAFRTVQNRSQFAVPVDSLNPSFNADNNLQELLLGNLAQKKELKLSVSGGTKDLKYFTSLNYMDDESIILNSWAKRLQSRINVEYSFLKKLKYSNNISFSWQKGNSIPIANTVRVVIDRPAYSLIYYPDGSLTSYIASKRNPVANALYEQNLGETYAAQFNNQLEYQFFKDLKFTTLFNARLDNYQNAYFSPRFIAADGVSNTGRNRMDKDFKWEYQAYFNYNKTIATDHEVLGMLGFSAERRRLDRFNTAYQNSVNEEILVSLSEYLVSNITNTFATANATASIFGRLGYNYKGRYIAMGTYRRDGSSRFGTDNRWGDFLSGSLAWRFSDEKFMSWSKKVLEDAKLRYSYGQLGNDVMRGSDYESYTKVSFSGSYNGVGGAALNTTFGNNLLKWEKTTQKNLGLDLSFLNGRLGFTADYYVKRTDDLLYQREIPKETGFTTANVNMGSIQVKGLEFVVSTMPVAKKDLKWTVNGNISFERGKILKLADGIPFAPADGWWVEEGGKIGDFYGWTNLGVYQWNESNAYNDNWEKLTVVLGDDGTPKYENGKPVYTLNGEPYAGKVNSLYASNAKLQGGDSEWLNLKKDSLIDDADRHILGNYTPDFYFGIVNNISYKQFTLNFMFNGAIGGEIYNNLLYRQNYPSNTGAGSPDMTYNSWRKPGDIAKYPYYPERSNRGNQKAYQNSLYIEDASFIRLSSARFSYTLKPEWARKVYARGLTAYVYGVNLLTWTNYRGYDPEFSAGSALTPGRDDGKYPRRREFGFGLNVNF